MSNYIHSEFFQRCTWDEYYDKFYDWAERTQVCNLSMSKAEIGRLPICQNDEYIDVEDHIKRGKAQLAALVASCTLPASPIKE